MVMLPITIRKRTITPSDLLQIQAVIEQHWDEGRTPISRILCQMWNWVQPNGSLKDMACRELLLTLERSGYLCLPPRKADAHNDKRNRSIPFLDTDQTPIEASLADLPPVEIKLARNTPLESLYNSLIDRHHYLGYRQIVGSHLKYMAFMDQRPVACLGWGSAAWSVKSREAFIGWDKSTKEKNLHLVVNNTRFLILPWVKVKCLASKILALNAKRISADWVAVYHYPVVLLETFVEKDRFQGTCYRAANWQKLGETKGTAKRGHDHLVHGSIKDVYVYPLRKNFRKELCGT
jgi:hypothetical protein